MSFLPIIERELLVGSRRKKASFRVRWWTTLIGTGATFICLGYCILTKPLPSGVTNPLFAGSGDLCFLIQFARRCFFNFGLFKREKRRGTLGLLFLSNLSSNDIVLGKFSARFLNAFFNVLALLPVMGIPLLLGGLNLPNFREWFWR